MPGNPPPKPPDAANAPHFHCHREWLRERFRDTGADALSDYELLETVLFRALPCRDVKSMAKHKFGPFAEVVHAPTAAGSQRTGRARHDRAQVNRRRG